MRIFVDIDGVLADFYTEWAKISNVQHWKDIPNQTKSFEKMKNTDFFRRLPKFPTSDYLINVVKEYTKDWFVLSSPLDGDEANSTLQKMRWINDQGYDPVGVIVRSDKEVFAFNENCSPCLLIDDHMDNCTRWVESGGVAILYQANMHNIWDLDQAIFDLLDTQEPRLYELRNTYKFDLSLSC